MKPLVLSLTLIILSCDNDSHLVNKKVVKIELPAKDNIPDSPFTPIQPLTFVDSVDQRFDIKMNLISKKQNNEPLIVHAFVPLCDNENQGIVPTTESLGNGFSLRSNLYWATSNGMKKYFQKSPWHQISQEGFEPNDTVLERVVFERHLDDCKIILVCDAYRGDMMKPCLEDYFSALAGLKNDSIKYADQNIDINRDADMVVFNGHNGLMDLDMGPVIRNPNERFFKRKDAVVIACTSQPYFNEHFMKTDSYPLVTTTSLLYPGAFILNGIIEKWAVMESEEEIKNAAGDAYNEVKACGQQAARNMFSTGW